MPLMSNKITALTRIYAFLAHSVSGLTVDSSTPDYYPFPAGDCLRALGSNPTYEQGMSCFHESLFKRDIEGPGSDILRRGDSDVVPDYLPFPAGDCLLALGPNPTYEQGMNCFHLNLVKRDIEGPGFSFPRRAAAELQLSKPMCDDTNVPKQFVTVDIVRAFADAACDALDDKIKTAGIGTFNQMITNTLTKSGPTIHGGANVLLSVTWALSPLALKAVGGQLGDVNQLCHTYVQKLATKGEGCTGELSGYKNGLRTTVTGGINGVYAIKSGSDQAGLFSIAYLPPNTSMP